MTSRSFPFTNSGVHCVAMGHNTERVSLLVGPHAYSITLHMSATEARAMAVALEAAATPAENALATGLGESEAA
jgi:hypothetical protein